MFVLNGICYPRTIGIVSDVDVIAVSWDSVVEGVCVLQTRSCKFQRLQVGGVAPFFVINVMFFKLCTF